MIYKAGDAITLTMLYLLLFLVGFLTGVCQCCETGYYSSNGECQKCPNNCTSCGSASLCTFCNAGFYGETCSEYCPVYCHNKLCNQISGQCLSCKEGYYNDENKSCSKCPKNCTTCISKHFCFACRSGYKGEYCQSVCSSCKPGTSCDKNTGYCHVDCVDGFSGELCDTPCDYKCESCNRYKQQECISCASYRYGQACDEQCSKTCDLNICDVRNGSCTSGCITGYWGEMCEQKCSRQCKNQVCYQSNGECKDGCIEEFSGMDCSTRKNSVSRALIGGIIACVVVIFCVCVFVVSVYITRKRRGKWCDSSLCEDLPHLLCTSDKTTKEPEEEPLKPVKERQVNIYEDMEKMLAQPRKKSNVNEEIFQQITIEAEKENKTRASDVSISIQVCPKDDRDIIGSKTTLPTELKASSDKQETLPQIHVTAQPEDMDNRKAKKNTVDIKMPLTTHSIEKTNTDKAENKSLPITLIKKGNECTYMDKPLEKQIEEPDMVRNTEENKNARLNDERILKTSPQGKTSTISKRPTLSSLKKDENDETNNFQGFETNNNNRVETSDDNKEHLSVNVRKSENMKINDKAKATYCPIPMTTLAQYVANKDKSDYTKEFQSRAPDVSMNIEGCPQDEINVIASKNTFQTQFKASPNKQESVHVPLTDLTAKPEEMDNRKVNKELFDTKKSFTTHSSEKENTHKAETKPLPDTQIKKGNGGTYIDRHLGKQIEEPYIVRNTEKNKNARLKDERILKTPRHGKASTISKIPTLSYPKNDEKDETNKSQGFETYNNNWVETFDDNKKHLSVDVRKSENTNLNDKATYSPIPVTRLAHYVANKDKSDYTKEFRELSKAMNSINENKTLTEGHTNKLQTNIQIALLMKTATGSPVILDGELSTNIDAYFINAEPYVHKAYISYIGPSVMLSSCKKAFWKTVLQERCGTIVMLTCPRECSLLLEAECICSFKGLPCSVKYGDITVVCKGETNFGSFTVRKYTIMKKMMEKVVQRLHFTKWPSYGLPDDTSSFVDFVRYANTLNNPLDGPTLVYCSSGIERTGVYIALDILTKQGNDTGFVDIFGCVRHLREQRVNMIRDCKQYKFLHKALVISPSNTSYNRQAREGD